jgi:hypothetical protein
MNDALWRCVIWLEEIINMQLSLCYLVRPWPASAGLP